VQQLVDSAFQLDRGHGGRPAVAAGAVVPELDQRGLRYHVADHGRVTQHSSSLGR
jgi:hypothetical protein